MTGRRPPCVQSRCFWVCVGSVGCAPGCLGGVVLSVTGAWGGRVVADFVSEQSFQGHGGMCRPAVFEVGFTVRGRVGLLA